MTHRSVAIAVRLTVLLFGVGVLVFALAVRTPGGASASGELPPTHRAFAADTCATCHPGSLSPRRGPERSR